MILYAFGISCLCKLQLVMSIKNFMTVTIPALASFVYFVFFSQ